ncbi:5-oxoprolinase (ATP-hydrolyzing) subunit A, partial [Tremellales sp. Uapishka_1]
MVNQSTSETVLHKVEINVDCGEAFGLWEGGPDEDLMPMIDAANIACGGHAGDPVIMRRTVGLAKKYGVKVGAHPGFPDKAGFGRRALAMSAEQAYAEMLFQVGALKAFLDEAELPLNHIKPHGMWYIMMQDNEEVNDAAMRAIKHFNVPVYGMPNTLHESGAKKYGIPFIPEAFVDVNYTAKGVLLGVPGSRTMEPDEIYSAVRKLVKEGTIPSVDYVPVDLGVRGNPFTLCLHSDFKGCRENVKAARKAVDEMNEEMYR